MRGTSGETSKISREGANVGAAAASDAYGKARLVAGEDLPAVYDDARGSEFELLPATCRGISTRPAKFLRGVRRRDLIELAGEARNAFVDSAFCWRRSLARRGAGRVVGIGFPPERDRRVADLRPAVDERQQPRAASNEENEQPRGKRVEGARMSDASRMYAASNNRHDVVRRYAGGFVDEEESRDVSRQDPHWRPVAGPTKSAREATRSAPRARCSDRGGR